MLHHASRFGAGLCLWIAGYHILGTVEHIQDNR
jgi:hypothetical protein